jgi:beta-N-acetylhexosaminidase
MRALDGEPADLAVQAIAAGCDLALYCSGEYAPTEALLSQCPPLTDQAAQRLAQARAKAARRRLDLDAKSLALERDRSLP